MFLLHQTVNAGKSLVAIGCHGYKGDKKGVRKHSWDIMFRFSMNVNLNLIDRPDSSRRLYNSVQKLLKTPAILLYTCVLLFINKFSPVCRNLTQTSN